MPTVAYGYEPKKYGAKKKPAPAAQFHQPEMAGVIDEAGDHHPVPDLDLVHEAEEAAPPPMPAPIVADEAPAVGNDWSFGIGDAAANVKPKATWPTSRSGSRVSVKGLFVFHIHVGQAEPEKAIDLMKMVRQRYEAVEDRLRDNGYESMWLPTRGETKTEFFGTP